MKETMPFRAAALPFAFSGVRGVRCLFSTIHAGDMALSGDAAAPLGNRQRFMDQAGFRLWAELRQVHGDVLTPASGTPAPVGNGLVEADGQYTSDRGVGLVIKTADCQPLLFARSDGGAIAALHVGWRGNARNLPGKAVAELCREFACGPADLLAVRGPSLGPAAAEFVNFADEWPPEFAIWHDSASRTVDLWAVTRHQLEEAGLPAAHIHSLDLCTHTMADCFFSHRRKDAGRQISVIWRE